MLQSTFATLRRALLSCNGEGTFWPLRVGWIATCELLASYESQVIQVRSGTESIVRYFAGGTHALSSSNQFRTTMMLVGADVTSGPAPSSIIRNRWPSGETS